MKHSAAFVVFLTLALGVARASADDANSARKRAERAGKSPGGSTPGSIPGPRARSSARSPAREHRLESLQREKKRATCEDELAEAIHAVWSSRPLRRGTTAIYVADAVTGRQLYAVQEDESLNPASNVKLISTAAALDTLGPDYRYAMRVLGPPPSASGVIAGDLYLLGSHDPTLRHEHVRAIAASLVARGVTRVHGNIYVGRDRWRDSVARPRITIRVEGTESGQPPRVTVEPATALVSVRVTATTDERRRKRRRSHLALTLQRIENPLVGNSYELEVAGTIAAGRRTTARRWLNHGAELSAHILRQALIDAGVRVAGTVRRASLSEYMAATGTTPAVELAHHQSKSMGEIVAHINKFSLNRLADRVVMTAAAARYGGEPTMDEAVQLMKEWLREQANVNPNHVYLDTGSGLSYKTQLTVRQIAKVVRAATGYGAASAEPAQHAVAAPPDGQEEPSAAGHFASTRADVPSAEPTGAGPRSWHAAFVESLAVGGIDGTLRGRFRRGSLRGRVYGKTGTLRRVIALSGVVGDGDNAVVFAIVSNGHDRRKRGRVRKRHEDIVEAIDDYLQARTAWRQRRDEAAD